MEQLKWITISEYVDIETGELITKSEMERNYIIIKKNKKTEINGNYGTIKYTTECERNKQYKLNL